MQNNEFISSIQLKYPNAQIPTVLASKGYRCEVSCYDPKHSSDLLPYLEDVDVLRITANKLNVRTGKLFTSKQTFYVSKNPRMDQVIDDLIDANDIPSTRVSLPTQFDWNEFYNISVEWYNDESELIKFHQTVEGD